MPVTTTPCQKDPEQWFPVGAAGPAVRQSQAAAKACAECPIMSACREAAYASGQVAGVWGGLDFDRSRQRQRWSAWGSAHRANEARKAARLAAK